MLAEVGMGAALPCRAAARSKSIIGDSSDFILDQVVQSRMESPKEAAQRKPPSAAVRCSTTLPTYSSSFP